GAKIEAGVTAEMEMELEIGITVTGIVVDPAGVPVAGALVEVAMSGRADAAFEPLATTGADGRFRVRGAPTSTTIGARAAGFTASPVRVVNGREGNTADVRLVLGSAGGVVDGLVVDPDGVPVGNAATIVGAGSTTGAAAGMEGGSPAAALVRTNA